MRRMKGAYDVLYARVCGVASIWLKLILLQAGKSLMGQSFTFYFGGGGGAGGEYTERNCL